MYLNTIGLLLVLTIQFRFQLVDGKTCPGKCVENATICNSTGGKIVAYCTIESPCCDFTAKYTGSCGMKMQGPHSAIFKSPSYPEFDSGDLICDFQLDLSSGQYDGIMLDFEDVYTEGCGIVPPSPCDADMIFIKGFRHWQPPPRCGNLTGYVAVIDRRTTFAMKSIKILALMSSFHYRWKIKISLIRSIKSPRSEKNSETENELHDDMRIRYMEINQHDTGMNEGYRKFQSGGNQISPQNRDLLETLIVNGNDTNITDVPWQASIRTFYPDYMLKQLKSNNTDQYNQEKAGCKVEGKHFCGGSVIGARHILSAAHCFQPQSKFLGWKQLDTIKVYLGETDLCEDNVLKYGRKTQNFSVEKIMYHYAYDDKSCLLNDVVVLKLKETIQFNEYIKPIALSKRNKLYSGQKAKASGWGVTNMTAGLSTASLMLKSAEILVENKTHCNNFLQMGWSAPKNNVELYPKYKGSFDTVLCTSSKNDSISKSVGYGDSGGPLIIFDNEHDPPVPIQIGIVSYKLAGLQIVNVHDNAFVDFFQDVSVYRNWIDLAMSV